MTSKELKTLIRELVKEEVKAQFPYLISEILNSSNSSPQRSRIEESEAPVVKRRVPQVQIKTGNPALDSILSETTGLPAEPTNYGQSVMSEGFDMIGKGIPIPQTDVNGHPVNVDALPESLITGLTKNYSGFMKKVNKAVNNVRPPSI